MPTRHKIALFGMGRIGRILYSGAAALSNAETKAEKSVYDLDLSKLLEPADYKSLVRAYKKVQKKYYPEKDVLVEKLNKGV